MKFSKQVKERQDTHTLLFTESKPYWRPKYQGAHIWMIKPKEQILKQTKSIGYRIV